MFSVDNFYDFMNSHYGLEADGRNVLWNFHPHGSKNWQDLRAMCMPPGDHKHINWIYDSKNSMIFHDQEPFDPALLDTYNQQESIKFNEPWLTHQSLDEVLLTRTYSTGWPIFCHSEFESNDIKLIGQFGAFSCYYFWHGLISRDWFRHWKHHGGITIDKPWQHLFLLYARDFSGSREYRQKIISDLLPIKHMVHYNWDHNNIVSADHSAKISVDDAQTSAIHLISETIFDREKIHLTEKTFKPMVMMQPFILFAGTGSLQYLRRYGFKTFHEIWDESYDLEVDHVKRYQKIIDLIRYLSSLDVNKFQNILKETNSIVRHNHQHFYSQNFEDMMLTELRINMNSCLELQREKNKQFPGGGCVYALKKRIDRGHYPPNHIARLSRTMAFIQTNEPSRYAEILKQNSWLVNYLI